MQQIVFDYIVVGGGSAGCVVAARLSQNPNRSVLLLERGGWDRSIKITIPGLMVDAIETPRLNWRYRVDRDPSMLSYPQTWNAGRVLGGSSAINGMVFARGAPSNFDEWLSLGNADWGWSDLLPYFKRIERWVGRPHATRGLSGPMCVAPMSECPLIVEKFVEAAVKSGMPFVEDLNSGVELGVGLTQTNQVNGRRHSAARAYLHPVLRRTNLKIITDALVTRTLLAHNRCIGVEFVVGTKRITARATSEVILTAGAIGSPKILLNSGIGPGGSLRSFGIKTQLDLPGVGHNLQEHASINLTYATQIPTYNSAARGYARVANAVRWLVSGKGPAASPANHAQGYFRSDSTAGPADIQLQFCAAGYETINDRLRLANKDQVVIGIAVCQPQMRGQVKLKSDDPIEAPSISFQLQGSPADREILIRGAERVREIVNEPPIRECIRGPILPANGLLSIGEWTRYLRHSTTINFHPVGTCRMGQDQLSVVDAALRLHQVAGLSVADASIMPRITSGNTNAPTLAIAEKASDLIIARTA